MNTEQGRAEFEAWAQRIGFPVTGKYAETIDVLCAEETFNAGYQAGRAALQSQDKEDAERYRWLRKHWFTMTSCYDGGRVEFTTGQPRYSSATEANVDEAIDHARRIEENK